MEARMSENTGETLPTPEQVEEARRTLQRVRDAALQQAHEADRLIHEYPYQSVGIAAALGLLVGMLIIRR